jgi:hypothetical protein
LSNFGCTRPELSGGPAQEKSHLRLHVSGSFDRGFGGASRRRCPQSSTRSLAHHWRRHLLRHETLRSLEERRAGEVGCVVCARIPQLFFVALYVPHEVAALHCAIELLDFRVPRVAPRLASPDAERWSLTWSWSVSSPSLAPEDVAITRGWLRNNSTQVEPLLQEMDAQHALQANQLHGYAVSSSGFSACRFAVQLCCLVLATIC